MKGFKEIYWLFLLMSKNGEENAIVLQYTNGWRILFFTIMTWYSTLLMFCHMMLFLIPSKLFVFSLYIIWCVLSSVVFFFHVNKGACTRIYFLSPPLFIQTVHWLWSPTMENPIFMYMYHFFFGLWYFIFYCNFDTGTSVLNSVIVYLNHHEVYWSVPFQI